ncbi:MAG: iron-containing alcohol dehydrogenase [Elusimicrobiota bacterium]|jgi:glycerol dehydrogenase|nr:iron-containing alcohol dehydrogenase [Elusimicrobiota bacterium]
MKNFDFLTIAPSRVIADINLFQRNLLEKYKFVFGNNPVLIVRDDVLSKFNDKITKVFNNKDSIIQCNEECSQKEISRIVEIIKTKNISSIVGMGGGKAIDIAKAVANFVNLAIITIPTSSATGACSSALSTIYTEDGNIDKDRDIIFTASPNFVFIDYDLILDEPRKFVIFGITDSLAKYYESFAFTNGKSNDIFTQTALNLAENIKKTIFQIHEKAISDFDNKILSDELKHIFKINLVLAPLIGGLGGEGCRVCISHAVNNSLTQIKKIRQKKFMHGEQVAFGNLLQLYLDKRVNAKQELKELLNLYKKLGLMKDFDYFRVKLDQNDIDVFMNHIYSDSESLKNMPRAISKQELLECMKHFKMLMF